MGISRLLGHVVFLLTFLQLRVVWYRLWDHTAATSRPLMVHHHRLDPSLVMCAM
jgi:hypothetical protein